MIQESQNAASAGPATRRTFGFTIAQIVLSALGCIDAGLLTLKDMPKKAPIDLPCTADGGCEKVAASTYAHLHFAGLDIPLAAVGLAGYIVLLSLAMAKGAAETPKGIRWLSTAILVISGGATVYSWYLQYVAKYVIVAFCPYCRASAIIMTVLFIVSIFDRRSLRSAASVEGAREG